MVVTLQGNPALLPPLAKGLKIFVPKKRTDWGLGVSPDGGVPVWGRGKQRFLHKYLSMSGESVTFAPVKSHAQRPE